LEIIHRNTPKIYAMIFGFTKKANLSQSKLCPGKCSLPWLQVSIKQD